MKNLKKPNFIVNSRKGSIYTLTPLYTKQLINNVQISIGDFVLADKVLDSLKEHNLSFRKYIGLPDQLIYASPLDHYKNKQCIKGKNKKEVVSILGQNGYVEISNEKYMEIVKQMNPDIAVQLTEFSLGGGKGSSLRAVEKSVEFLDQMIEKMQEINKNRQKDEQRTSVYASIQGGLYEELRETSTQNICSRDIEGAVIHGLCQDETIEQRNKIMEIITKNIPKEKKDLLNIVLSGPGNPVDIMHALQFGVDYFEVEYPFKFSELGLALTLQPINVKSLHHNETDSDTIKLLDPASFDNTVCNYANLKDEKYVQEMTGLVENCQCYTCKNHTMGYINHLLKCHELTAHVLLTIHNVHTYNQLFAELQEAKLLNVMEEYIKVFLKVNCEKGQSPVEKLLKEREQAQALIAQQQSENQKQKSKKKRENFMQDKPKKNQNVEKIEEESKEQNMNIEAQQ